MKMKRAALSAFLLITAGLSCSSAGISQTQEPVRQSFDVQVPVSPVPVRIGDATRLPYALHLTNFTSRPLTLMRGRILDAATRMVTAGPQGPALRRPLGETGAPAQTRLYSHGLRTVVSLSVPITPAP